MSAFNKAVVPALILALSSATAGAFAGDSLEFPPLRLDYNLSPVQEADPRCDDYAKHIRSVAILRDMGVKPPEAFRIVVPMEDIPLGPVIKEVYERPDVSPDVGAKNAYRACRAYTFDAILKSLTSASR